MKRFFRRLFPNKEIRAYRKMHRRHRRELIKQAKETREWDWGWLHDSVIMQIRHMYEYYSEGNNVWQADESRLEIIKQLKRVLDAETEIEQMQNDNHGVEFVHEDDRVRVVYPDDYTERVQKWYDREQKLYEEIYGTITKYLKSWWD